MLKFTLALILVFGGGLLGCAGPRPIKELALATSAIKAAKDCGAGTFAPGFTNRAEDEFRKGQKAMQGNYNTDAKDDFDQARVYAEKAENSTRLKKFKSGEGYQ